MPSATTLMAKHVIFKIKLIYAYPLQSLLVFPMNHVFVQISSYNIATSISWLLSWKFASQPFCQKGVYATSVGSWLIWVFNVCSNKYFVKQMHKNKIWAKKYGIVLKISHLQSAEWLWCYYLSFEAFNSRTASLYEAPNIALARHNILVVFPVPGGPYNQLKTEDISEHHNFLSLLYKMVQPLVEDSKCDIFLVFSSKLVLFELRCHCQCGDDAWMWR